MSGYSFCVKQELRRATVFVNVEQQSGLSLETATAC